MSAALGMARPLAGAQGAHPEAAATRDRQAGAVAIASRVFAAQPLQVAQARRFVGGVLAGLGTAEDVVLCVSELASNAVLHSNSREPGGQFAVRVWITDGGGVRAEVEDRGGPWSPDPEAGEERGRGLLIVAALASRWGIAGSTAGRVAWLELDPA